MNNPEDTNTWANPKFRWWYSWILTDTLDCIQETGIKVSKHIDDSNYSTDPCRVSTLQVHHSSMSPGSLLPTLPLTVTPGSPFRPHQRMAGSDRRDPSPRHVCYLDNTMSTMGDLIGKLFSCSLYCSEILNWCPFYCFRTYESSCLGTISQLGVAIDVSSGEFLQPKCQNSISISS